MKKYIYMLCAMLATAFTSCNNNDLVPETDGTMQQVTLQVAPEQGLNTRANATGVNNFLIEVYSDAAYTTAANIFTGNTNKATSTNGSFTMVLDKTKEYYCLLWADKDATSEVYTTSNLKEVTLVAGKAPVEAWQGKLKIEKGTTAALSVTLTRAVAKITLLETGVLKAGTLTMTFDQSTKFNVSAGTTSTTAQRIETINFSAIDPAVPTGSKINTNDIFVLASTTDAEQPTITFQITSETEAISVSNVPLKANYNTNIKGHYSKENDVAFTITCDDTWNAPDKEGTIDQNAYFPDAALRTALKTLVPGLVEENGDIDPTSDVNKALIEAKTSLNVSKKGLTSLKGIEYFTALTTLNCFDNSLTALDVSKNINLTTLYCHTNSLTDLDLSKNTKLTTLICSTNSLTTLDLSENVNLTKLTCTSNSLTTLDLSKNVNLTTVYCDDNLLTALDLSKNENLTGINCNNNQIETSTLTLPATTTSLLYLMCSDNKLTSLDISAYTGLKSLVCSGNQMSSLAVSKNTELTTLHCFDNRLSTLDITTLTKLDMNTGGSDLFFSCGKQKDENGGARTLTLTVTDAQKTEFETNGVHDVENNSGVTLSVKN